ncbi:MAG: hypothetical protein U0Q16_10715 [Bryobacteraceae bacterium]
MLRALAFWIALPLAAQVTSAWKLVYFHDEEKSSLSLHDIAFGSTNCGAALGAFTDERRARPVAMVTHDGGTGWKQVAIKPEGHSLFFLDEHSGWMAANDGIYRSGDCGETWERVHSVRGVERVYFRDPQRGYAVGHPKLVLQTSDGGTTWSKLPDADKPTAAADRSSYGTVAFQGNFGVIVGRHRPKRNQELKAPAWMDPEAAKSLRQLPSLTLLLQTVDGGSTWRANELSILGHITRFRITPNNAALSLVEFENNFEFPSEVYRVDLLQNQTTRVFREANRAVTDLLTMPTGVTHLAATEPPGSLRQLPIPGKVKMLRSADLAKWEEVPVDYRAVARRVTLGAGRSGPVIAVTDTGMILRLVAVAPPQ